MGSNKKLMTKVSIIIPTYNRANLLKQAIQSVLDQSFSDFELLILDDASTDNTEEIVKSFIDVRIRYTRHLSNIGITKNRNYGLSKSIGEYIAMLDSDDLWISNNKLKKQVEFLDSNIDFGIVGTYSKILGQNNKPFLIGKDDAWMRRLFLIKNQIFQSSVLFRKNAVNELGFYDEALPIWEDYELWLRIGTKYKFANIPEFLTGYRIHEKNITKEDKMKGINASLMIIEKYKNKYPNYWLGYLKIFLKKNLWFL